jgi:hypothetical protein
VAPSDWLARRASSTQLDDLQQRAADAKTSAQAAVSESRDQLRQRIDQAKVDLDHSRPPEGLSVTRWGDDQE